MEEDLIIYSKKNKKQEKKQELNQETTEEIPTKEQERFQKYMLFQANVLDLQKKKALKKPEKISTKLVIDKDKVINLEKIFVTSSVCTSFYKTGGPCTHKSIGKTGLCKMHTSK